MSTDWKSIAWNATDREAHAACSRLRPSTVYTDLPPGSFAPKLISAGFPVDHRPGGSTVQPHVRSEYVQLSPDRGHPVLCDRSWGLTDVEVAEWTEDLRRLGEHGNYFICLNQYLYVLMKPARVT